MKCRINTKRDVIFEQRLADHVLSLGLGAMCEVIREELQFGAKGRVMEFVRLFKEKLKFYQETCHSTPYVSKMTSMADKVREDAREMGIDYQKRDLSGKRISSAYAQDLAFMISTMVLHERWGIPTHGKNGSDSNSVIIRRLLDGYNSKVHYLNSVIMIAPGTPAEEQVSTADMVSAHLESIGIDPDVIFKIVGYDTRVESPRYDDCI